jgi:tetratricopeptide (TPR) repeat protein
MSFLKKSLKLFALSMSLTALGSGKPSPAITSATLDQAFEKLEENMTNRDQYLKTRRQVIETLKRHTTADESEKYGSIARGYENYDNDSVLHYYDLAARHADDYSHRAVFEARRAAFLPLAGFISEAVNIYTSINVDSLAADARIEYYKSGHRMYDIIATFYQDYPGTAATWRALATECNDALLKALDGDTSSPLYKLTRGQHLFEHNDFDKAKTLLRDVFMSQPAGDEYRSRAQVLLSKIAYRQGEKDAELYYLVNSVNDLVTAGSLEINSLFNLGMAINETGDTEHAYRFLSMALNDADKAHEWMRMLPIAKSMSIIQSAHDVKVESHDRAITIAIIILSAIIIALAVIVIRLRRALKKEQRDKSRIDSANTAKETYISQFVSMCAVYMEKLNEFVSLVSRKIAAGKANDVTRMLNQGKFLEAQNAEFYEIFDDALLNMYPNFVEEVNKLMQPEFRIELKEGERMNTDLRLLALMRLGVDDSAKIARILNYSLNTVYTYRNKLKSHALNRDTFEADLLRIPGS